MARTTKKTTAATAPTTSAKPVVETVETVKATVAPVAAEAAPAAKKASAAKKTAAPRVKKTVTVNLQYGGKDLSTDDLAEQAVQNWADATKQAKAAAKDVQLYVKPEEDMVYYVINGETGSFAL